MHPLLPLMLGVAVALAACQRTTAPDPSSDASSTEQARPLNLGPEDLVVIGQNRTQDGPVISGSIQAARKADLRAEVSAIVLQTLKENGERVRKGELLITLDASVLRENLASAEEAARAASQSFDSAERQLQRLKALQAQGMVSMQALEESEVRRNAAQSEWVAARARISSARQQLERTEIRAPFDGVISARKVSAGDNVQAGRELVQVIDPASTRFEGWVAADQAAALRTGQRVSFQINGWSQQTLQGQIGRIDASANPVTRQVGVYVELEPAMRPPVVGLYAEGRAESGAGGPAELVVPDSAVVRDGQVTRVWQLMPDGQLLLQTVQLGERNARHGVWPVRSGLQSGDRIIRHPGSQLKPGLKAQLRTPAQER